MSPTCRIIKEVSFWIFIDVALGDPRHCLSPAITSQTYKLYYWTTLSSRLRTLRYVPSWNFVAVMGGVDALNALRPNLKTKANTYTQNRYDELFKYSHDEIDCDWAGSDIKVPVISEDDKEGIDQPDEDERNGDSDGDNESMLALFDEWRTDYHSDEEEAQTSPGYDEDDNADFG
jgi:hypothetical protein